MEYEMGPNRSKSLQMPMARFSVALMVVGYLPFSDIVFEWQFRFALDRS